MPGGACRCLNKSAGSGQGPARLRMTAAPLLARLAPRARGSTPELHQAMQAWAWRLEVPRASVNWSFSRPRGPGGQNANKGAPAPPPPGPLTAARV